MREIDGFFFVGGSSKTLGIIASRSFECELFFLINFLIRVSSVLNVKSLHERTQVCENDPKGGLGELKPSS